MTAEQLESTLRQFLRQEPFRPFVVELYDGNRIEINRPGLAIGGGGASFLSPDWELVEFNCEEVRDVRQVVEGAAHDQG